MKRFLLVLCLASLVTAVPIMASDSLLDLPKLLRDKLNDEDDQDQTIFSDAQFSQPAHNFNPGQTVYVRVEETGSGDRQKLLRLLDNDKNEILHQDLLRSGNGPYIYTLSFLTPNQSGIYYVDIKIESTGSSFASQENITVGVAQNQQTATSQATLSTPLATSSSLPQTPPEKPFTFLTQLIIFLQKLLASLTNWWR